MTIYCELKNNNEQCWKLALEEAQKKKENYEASLNLALEEAQKKTEAAEKAQNNSGTDSDDYYIAVSALALTSPVILALAVITGCGENEDSDDFETVLSCYQHSKPTFDNLKQTEQLYTKDNFFLVANDKILPQTAKTILGKAPAWTNAELDLFGIESVYAKAITIYLVDRGSGKDKCTSFSGACASYGNIYVPLNDNQYATLNSYPEKASFYSYAFYHELSHALRTDIAQPWWGLEEGLARYTEIHIEELLGREIEAVKMEEITYSINTPEVIEIDTSGYSNHIKSIVLFGVAKPYNNIRQLYYLIEDEDGYSSDSIFLNAYSPYEDLLLSSTQLDNEKGVVKIYKINDSIPLEGLGSCILVADDLDSFHCQGNPYQLHEEIECNDANVYPQGWQKTSYIMTDEGFVEFRYDSGGSFIELDDYEKYSEGDPDLDKKMQYYNTGFCFWELLRDNYGENVVNTIVQSMIDFSKINQLEETYFPFYKTVIDETGMTEDEATKYFETFSAPTGDEYYPLGGVCFDE
jgi:hypothetical protein